jgi:aspartyl-tRNA(Asn)/glutamyl-tRNA(Gln) amidotransferase subunit A
MFAQMHQPISARDRLEQCLARIADPVGEGARVCLTVYPDAARAAADASDARRRSGQPLGPLDGAVISIKDLFDIAGEVTRAGSKVLAEEASAATADAPVVARLRAAGAVVVAKTNMTEFAFSGVGANPHYGTPGNPADRTRIPGGSTSGGAVAVADHMCEIAIGTDTGGSTRIPAALCGIVGFKPSQSRIPTEGAFPLSFTFDSIGPMARSVADCVAADAVLAGEAPGTVTSAPPSGLKLGVAQGLPLEALDDTVAKSFAQALSVMQKAAARLSEQKLPLLDEMMQVNAKGGIVPVEAFSVHRERLQRRGTDVDPNVRARIERGGKVLAADYTAMIQERAGLVRAMDAALAGLDALVMPTTPIVAPTIAEVAERDVFAARNAALLRNTAIVNFFDLCAISLPLPVHSSLPAGLMLVARSRQDHRLFQIAAGLEALFAG